MVASSAINVFDDPSKRRSAIGDTEVVGILLWCTKSESMKQWVDLLSTRALKETQSEGCEHGIEDDNGMEKEFGSERADALRQTCSCAQGSSTRPSAYAEH
jgi:hypothetical protein